MNEQTIALKLIQDNPFQSQERDYSDVDQLALSIAEQGLQQKPTARSVNGHYQLKFGHRRLRAFQWLKENWKAQGLTDRYAGYSAMPLEVEELSDDQMFDHMVVENVHRKDLKPTEEAALIQQWFERHPNATSREAGIVFNKKDATIRGMVRLLDLPQEVKQKLDAGEISQNTARSFLSMQKLAPREVIVKTLKQIEEEAKEAQTSRWGGNVTPEEIIQDAMDSLDGVVEMWFDTRGGKPRAGDSDGWLLDMKNFPNRNLPALTPVELVIGLGVKGDDQALKLIDTAFESDDPFATLRDSLTAYRPELVAKLVHLINPPACSSCPFYTTLRGTHYCGMKTCYSRKAEAWARELLEKASTKLGIAIYDPEADGDFKVLEDFFSWRDSKDRTLFEKRSKDLRLAFKLDIDRKKDQHGYIGVPKGSVVIVVGKAMESLQQEKKEARVEKQEDDHLDEFISQQYHLLKWEAAQYVQTLFDSLNNHVFGVLRDSFEFQWGEDLLDDFNIRELIEGSAISDRRILALMLIEQADQGPRAATCKKYAEQLVATAKTWGVKIPARFLKLAEEYDTLIKEMKKSVAVETLRQAQHDAKERKK